jgi:hypothetical protein
MRAASLVEGAEATRSSCRHLQRRSSSRPGDSTQASLLRFTQGRQRGTSTQHTENMLLSLGNAACCEQTLAACRSDGPSPTVLGSSGSQTTERTTASTDLPLKALKNRHTYLQQHWRSFGGGKIFSAYCKVFQFTRFFANSHRKWSASFSRWRSARQRSRPPSKFRTKTGATLTCARAHICSGGCTVPTTQSPARMCRSCCGCRCVLARVCSPSSASAFSLAWPPARPPRLAPSSRSPSPSIASHLPQPRPGLARPLHWPLWSLAPSPALHLAPVC